MLRCIDHDRVRLVQRRWSGILRALSLLMSTALLLAPRLLSAQGTPPLEPNARIRVSLPDRELYAATAILLEHHGDSLTIYLVKNRQTIRVRTSELSMLQVGKGRRTNAAAGAGIGLLLGAAAGGLIAASSADDSCTPAANDPAGVSCLGQGPHTGAALVGGTITGGLLGLLLGAVIGKGVTSDKWESVPLRVSARRYSSGSGARVAASFALKYRF